MMCVWCLQLLVGDGNKKAGSPLPPAPLIAVRPVAAPTTFNRRYLLLKLCAVLLVLVLLMVLVFVGITIYHKAKNTAEVHHSRFLANLIVAANH